MKPTQRAMSALLLLLFLLLPWATFAEEEKGKGSAAEEPKAASGTQQQAEGMARTTSSPGAEMLQRQIQDTYAAAKKRSRRKSFKGYCGAYVANQLVVLGINESYLSANGKNTFDIYVNMESTSGGYRVFAYSAKKYTMEEALRAIMKQDPAADNILVGFQKGTSKAGKKYGHVLFIHGIRDGNVFFSDSCARTVDGVSYKEGEPIACSVSSFVAQYAGYKLDGVVYFKKMKTPPQIPLVEETASTNSEKLVSEG